MTLIRLNGVSKTYKQGGLWSSRRQVHALRDVSLSIEPGQCLAVVGASGSGKSTLGRLVLGLELPDAGDVAYKGVALSRLDADQKIQMRRNVQVVFQNSYGAVDPRFNAREIVAEPLRNYGGLKGAALTGRVVELLESVGLSSIALEKLPHQFSGGELQRICIARALALSPELVVLDEAVSSLDVLNQSRILDLLVRIRQNTKTAFLFITHDLRIVGKMADAVAIMEAGCLAFYSDNIRQPDALDAMFKNSVFQTLAQSIFPPMLA